MKIKSKGRCSSDAINNDACGCCEGVEILTPTTTYNRPGLSELAYRIGTHGSFLETMKARLSSSDFPELKGLTTRDSEDPSIALLDSWAIVADVLTFYQERIANEGYLRTADERRSILELSKLVGYKLRPGVASSVYLAYTLDENIKEEVNIPVGSRVQSIPGSDELPQVFETSEALKARTSWNNLKPRLTRPQTITTITGKARVYLKGISTALKPNDRLLITYGDDQTKLHRVKEVITDASADRTLVTLQIQPNRIPQQSFSSVKSFFDDLTLQHSLQPRNTFQFKRNLRDMFHRTAVNKGIQRFREEPWVDNLEVSPSALLGMSLASGEGSQATLKALAPELKETLSIAVGNVEVTDLNKIKVYKFQLKVPLFGHNVPRKTTIPAEVSPSQKRTIQDGGDWPIIENISKTISHEDESNVYLDASYDGILPGSWMIIETQKTKRLTEKKSLIVKAKNVDASQNRSKYGISAPTTEIEIDFSSGSDTKWIKISENLNTESETMGGDDFQVLRSTSVYAEPEELELAEEPVEEPIGECLNTFDETTIKNDVIFELDGFYDGLESGRWIIVSGEREIAGTSGVLFSELAMLNSVKQDVVSNAQGQINHREKIHTFITLANKLAYCFKRDTVTIHANIVKATHGETRQEILGSGNGSQTLQTFDLKQTLLTYVSASNPTGVDSTLKLYVNDIQWHETDNLADQQATDRSFTTQTDNENKTSIQFGNGKHGSRLPTGIENIKAKYRSGIGKAGNVRAEQISLLQSKPLGVKEVINPLRASGGADREKRDQARKNAPLAIKALDRLVSVQDYEDFSRTFAGVGKASAVEISDGRRQLVHITIAGTDDIPIDQSSDLYRNLRHALHKLGDRYQLIKLEVRELMLMVVSAGIRILPDYQWEPVVTQICNVMLNRFSFEQRELGQDILLSEVISVMQAVRGVAYIDVDVLGGIPEKKAFSEKITKGKNEGKTILRWRLLTPQEISEAVQNSIADSIKLKTPQSRIDTNLAGYIKNDHGVILHPAQLAFLTPDVPDTLILNQIE